MSATIPCLKGFLGRFQTGDLAKLSEGDTTYASGSRSESHGQSYALSSLDHKGGAVSRNRQAKAQSTDFRPDFAENSAVAYAERGEDNSNGSVRSFGSEQMIIHRRVEVEWETNTAPK